MTCKFMPYSFKYAFCIVMQYFLFFIFRALHPIQLANFWPTGIVRVHLLMQVRAGCFRGDTREILEEQIFETFQRKSTTRKRNWYLSTFCFAMLFQPCKNQHKRIMCVRVTFFLSNTKFFVSSTQNVVSMAQLY